MKRVRIGYNLTSILILLFVILICITGCAQTAKKLPPLPSLPSSNLYEMTFVQERILNSARTCDSPSSPKITSIKAIKNWKYGCFCGEEHPGYVSINAYFSVKPKDDIDVICRDHDVCWSIHGEYNGHCNDELLNRINYLRHINLMKGQGEKCDNVLSAIDVIFRTPFVKSKYPNDPSKESKDKVNKISEMITTAAFEAALSLLSAKVNGYPKKNEFCNYFSINEKELISRGIDYKKIGIKETMGSYSALNRLLEK